MFDKKIAGIVCEYNPFHSGHRYQIDEIRKMGYEKIVCVMSGNIVQRGEVAITDKYTRAECALKCGADLVLELPFPYSSASAEFFAAAGVRILHSVGADCICFGSECGDADELISAAKICMSDEFAEAYKMTASSNVGTAEAYFEAYKNVAHRDFPSGANDILGISYIKAILNDGIDMRVEVIKRTGSDYRDNDISNVANNRAHPSASMIRQEILGNGISNKMYDCVPKATLNVLKEAEEKMNLPCDMSKLDRAFLSYFRLMTPEAFADTDIAEAGGGLAERICKMSHKAKSYEELIRLSAGKKYPYARVRRALLNCMIGVKNEDIRRRPSYSQILGFNSSGRELLSGKRNCSEIPLVSKPADADTLGDDAARQSILSSRADSVFTLSKPKNSESFEYILRSPIIIG